MAPGRRRQQQKQHTVLLATAVLLLLLPALAEAATKWTFLVYMIADNDLECFGIDDLTVRPCYQCGYAARS